MTSKKLLRKQDYMGHIIEAISRIHDYIKEFDQEAFAKNELVQDAVIRNMEIIGEAANNIIVVDNEFAEKNKHLRLDQAYRMRNALSHGYYSVNLVTVWNTIQNDLPLLKEQIAEMLAQK